MTMYNQDFSMFAGQSRTIEFNVLDAAGVAMNLTGATLTWKVTKAGAPFLERVADVTNVTGGECKVRIEVADAIAKGTYEHQLILAKGADKETIAYGTITVIA